jgi:hypothetical protein
MLRIVKLLEQVYQGAKEGGPMAKTPEQTIAQLRKQIAQLKGQLLKTKRLLADCRRAAKEK